MAKCFRRMFKIGGLSPSSFMKMGVVRFYCKDVVNKPSFSIPLSEPLPGLSNFKYNAVSQDPLSETKVTVLDNGLRVASQYSYGHFSTVGVFIDSGSRYEARYPSGISHYLERLGFSSTTQYKGKDEILNELGKHGGICDCQGSRDSLVYATSVENTGLDVACKILSEVILRPAISSDELDYVRQTIQFELDSLLLKHEPDVEIMELIHAAAYRDNTLGYPKLCPSHNIASIDQTTLDVYLQDYHTPERMVLAGVGMQHEDLVDAAKQHFLTKQPIWKERLPPLSPSYFDNSTAQYTGGHALVERNLGEIVLGPNELPELAHVIVGCESCSHKDDDFIAFSVLQIMMGGGGSFSAGGPGKGMYTRLYLNVLNRQHWIHSATAFNHVYEDSGLFGIQASAHPLELKALVEIICKELAGTTGKVDSEELSRAKRQLQSTFMMSLEFRPVMFEDIGRQVLFNGLRKPPQFYYDEIGKITEEDIQRVARRMLQSKVSLAALGSLKDLPSYEDVQSMLTNADNKRSKMFSLF